MCSTPKTPDVDTSTPEPIASPTIADAAVTKARTNARNSQSALANRTIKSSALGVTGEAETEKKVLLGQ